MDWAELVGFEGPVLVEDFDFWSGKGWGGLNLVSSLETFVWPLVRVFWGRGRVGFVAPFCLAEISRAAICRVTAPIVAILQGKQRKAMRQGVKPGHE